jgi:hypothetical protein
VAAAFVAAAEAGDAQTAQVSSLSITIPAGAAAGQVAVLTVNNSSSTNTLTTPTGWAVQSGPDVVGTNSATWLFTKTLVSGDPGSSVSLAFGAAARVTADMAVYSGVTVTGVQVGLNSESTATATPTLPSLTGVPAGAAVHASFGRRRSGAAASGQRSGELHAACGG